MFQRERLVSWRRVARGLPFLIFFCFCIICLSKNGPVVHTKKSHMSVPFGDCNEMERQVDEIQLHVIGWRRLKSLQQLMSQLETSSYNGWEFSIPLYIHVDGGASQEVITAADGFLWTHGRKVIDKRSLNVGLREMWISSIGAAAKAAGDNSLMVVFEDDTVVSTDYFQWILAIIDAYGRNTRCRDSNLMGFSLSPIRLEELSKPFTRWNSRVTLGYNHIAYLSVVPSSWGAAYWSDRWNEFSKFVDIRMKPPYYDVKSEMTDEGGTYNYDTLRLTPEEFYIPDSRSNVWPKSWKRFMIDWMYARGLVMLYPSLPEEKGLASTLALPGEHVSTSASKNPRVADLQLSVDREMFNIVLPQYDKLPVIGLHLHPTTRVKLALDGEKFLHSVRAKCLGCDELLRLWARSEVLVKDSSSTCAPDLYMPTYFVNASRTAVKRTAVKRYLLLEPQYGGNNQLFAIMEALRWSKILGRQLVLPPILLPRVSDFDKPYAEWPVTSKFFNFVGDYEQPISFQEWFELGVSVHRIIRISRDAVFDKTTHVLKDQILENTKLHVPTVNLRHLFDSEMISRSLTPEHIDLLLGGCGDEALLFEGMFFSDVRTGMDKGLELVETATLSDFTSMVLHHVKARLEENFAYAEYACYHVRAGDFVSMCGSGVSHDNPFYSWKHKLLQQGYKCAVSVEETISAIVALGMPAIVMSNEYTRVFGEDPQIKGIELVSSSWIFQLITEYSPVGTNKEELEILSLIIEQELCSDAKFSILNIFSTVSKRIKNIRQSKGKSSLYWSSNLVSTLLAQKR